MKSRLKVIDMARQTGLDVDDVLLELWNVGLLTLLDEQSVIPREKLKLARDTLGLINVKDEMTVAYWLKLTGLSFFEFRVVIQEFGYQIDEANRKVPKNCLRKLRFRFQTSQPLNQEPPLEVATLPRQSFEIPRIGTARALIFLTEADAEEIHTILTNEFRTTGNPIFPPGVKSRDLLSSAMSRPMFEHEGHRKYPSLELASAALFHAIIHDHPFHNGNKRSALVAMLTMLDRNGYVLNYSQAELFREAGLTAQHNLVDRNSSDRDDREMASIADWLSGHLKLIKLGEHPMKWGELRHRLTDLGCEIENLGGFNNHLRISRSFKDPGFFRPNREGQLFQVVPNWDSGQEVKVRTIHELRKKLELDEVHGCDTNSFYRTSFIVDRYIVEHRRILDRLAKI